MTSLIELRERGQEFTSRAASWFAQATRVLEQPETDWIRNFMLSEDNSMVSTILLSSQSNKESVIMSVSLSAFRSGPCAQSCSLTAVCLFVPAFTQHGYSVGIVVQRESRLKEGIATARASGSTYSGDDLANLHAIGKYCLHHEKSEILIVASRIENENENIYDVIANAVTQMTSVPMTRSATSLQHQPTVMVLWWAPQSNYHGTWPAWSSRKELTATCDAKNFRAGKYSESMIVSNISENIFRESCSECADQVPGLDDIGTELIFNDICCTCDRSVLSSAQSSRDLTLASSLRCMEGDFVGTSDLYARIPSLGGAISIDQLLSSSVRFSHDSELAGLMQNLAITNVIQRSAPMLQPPHFIPHQLQNEFELIDGYFIPEQDHNSGSLSNDRCETDHLSQYELIPNGACNREKMRNNLRPTSRHEQFIPIAPRDTREIPLESSAYAYDRERIAKAELRKRKNRQAATASNSRRREHNNNLKRNLNAARLALVDLRKIESELLRENVELKRRLRQSFHFGT